MPCRPLTLRDTLCRAVLCRATDDWLGFTVRSVWLQVEDQATDRVHRIGQEHDAMVHWLFMAGNDTP